MTITKQRVVDADHPWLGLSPYTEATQEFFFGRDLEVRELFRRVREQPLTILFGQSGLGKTSLLGAGLIPKLRVERFRPTLLRLGYEQTDPPLIQQIVDAISKTISTEATPFALTLWERFHHIASRPSDLEDSPLVLIFDQFEEIFTLTATKERQAEASEIFRQLADLIENRPPQSVQERMRSDRRLVNEYDLGPAPIHIVITLREDFLSQLESYKKLMPSLMRNRMALRMLNGPQALEAVVRPGRLQGRNLCTDEVGKRIVRFVADRTPETPLEEIDAVPPLLSLLCDELNQLRLEQRQRTIEGHNASLGGLELVGRSILDSFYTRSFTDLHPAVRAYVEDRMVTVGGHRNPIAYEDALAELAASGVDRPSNAINQLVQGRLLSVEDRGGIQRLEITHDVLAPLVVRSRDERRERQRAEKAELEREEARQREVTGRHEQTRLQLIAVAMSVLALVAICGMVWAVVASNYARRQERLAIEANEHSNDLANLALNRLKAIETTQEVAEERVTGILAKAAQSDRATARIHWKLGRHRDALAYWGRSFEYSPNSSIDLEQIETNISAISWPQSIAILNGRESINGKFTGLAVFSPDGTRIVIASKLENAEIWDTNTGRQISTLIGSESYFKEFAVFSPDGARIVIDSRHRNARIWDTNTGLQIATLIGSESTFFKYAVFSPDGTRIVIASELENAEIWDTNTGFQIATLNGQKSVVKHAAFSPDGMRVVTASLDDTARIWDAIRGLPIATLKGHEDGVNQAAFSPDGMRVVTASLDGTARNWDAITGLPIATLNVHKGAVTHAEFSPDGTRIVTASNDNMARVWEPNSGREIATLNGHESTVNHVKFSPDGMRIVTASNDKTARIWYANSGQSVATLNGHEGAVNHVEFSPDGTRIVATFSYFFGDTSRIWDASSGQSPATPIPAPTIVKGVPPDWFSNFLRFLGRRSHDPNGELVDWQIADESPDAQTMRKAIAADQTRYGDIARYFLTPHPDKPTYPGSKVTCGVAADQLIRPKAEKQELERAYSWNPSHPLIQIALAKFEKEPVRSNFLREYGVSRLLKRSPTEQQTAAEIAKLCRRAEALLMGQDDQPRAELVRKRAEELEAMP